MLSRVFGSGDRRPTGRPSWPVRLRDHLQATDPALARLRSGWRMLAVFATTLAVGYGMARALGHPIIFGLTYGGMVGLLVGLTVAGPAAGRVAVRCVWGVPAFLLALFCAIEVEPYRIAALLLAAAAVVVQVAAPAFLGEFGQDAGVMFFAGFLSGLLVPIPVEQMKYIAPIVAVAAVAAAVVQVLVCRMRPETGFVHVERGFLARARYVVRRSTRLLENSDPSTRAIRALRTEMNRLNDAAMLVDGYLTSSGLPGPTAVRIHRLVFDTERAAHALGRTTIQLCEGPLPGDVRARLLAALADHDAAPALLDWLARHEDDSRDPEYEHLISRLYRFVAVLGDLRRADEAWLTGAGDLPGDADHEPFTTPVELDKGRLPGAGLLAGRVLASGGMRSPWNVWADPKPELRIAVQTLIALFIVLPLGDALNGYRYYWALIGVLIVMGGTHSPHDRVRKTVKRVVGTLVGGFAGVGVAHLVGVQHPFVTVVLLCVALTVGAYAISAYYSVWAGALAFALIQLYAFTGGFEDSIVVLRAGENAIGAVVTTVVALVVLPVATRTLLRHAQVTHVRSLATFVRESGEVWSGFAGADGTREQARAVDQAAHELDRFSGSLFRLPGGDHERAEDIRATLRAAVVCAREMSVGSGEAVLTGDQRERLLTITAGLADSIDEMAEIIDGETPAFDVWIRAADDIRRLQRVVSATPENVHLRHALHYLGYLDDLLAGLAARLGIPVQGNDYASGARAAGGELFALRAQLVTVRQPAPVGGHGAATPLPSSPLEDSPVSGGSRWISGRVHGETGGPVPGAVLTLIDQRGHQVSRTTGGDDGSFRIIAPATGAQVLIVSANGYGPAALTPSSGSGSRCHDITLPTTGELSGTVRRAGNGAPVAEATVTLTDLAGEVVGAAITTTTGTYVCPGVLPGRYTLVANAHRMCPAAITLLVPESGRLRHDIEMTPTTTLTGRVRADAGAVSNAQVSVLDHTGAPIAHARTDGTGRYTIPGLHNGDYTVVTTGYPPVTGRVTIGSDDKVHTITLGHTTPKDSAHRRLG
ncbi:carboxypeptidase regulatory-like domain-containing protein [Nocardia nova]|uniref:carboxypeptidase regulatory-like domain-containing protein n=1 Tax=Nocardia nova TaxID=37330 RepID=UPI0034080225